MVYTFFCIICGAQFVGDRASRKTCSRKCRDIRASTGRTMGAATCRRCGRVFQRTLTELRRAGRYTYCSKVCARFANAADVYLPNIDPAFGYWLAGLTDGEGCFTFQVSPAHINVRFQIVLRDDDSSTLRKIHSTLGFGKLYHKPGTTKWGTNDNPQLVFQTNSTTEALAIEALFTSFPLQSKKRRDFETWCAALHEHLKGEDRSMERILFLRDKLVSDRRYAPPASL